MKIRSTRNLHKYEVVIRYSFRLKVVAYTADNIAEARAIVTELLKVAPRIRCTIYEIRREPCTYKLL